MTSDQEIFDEVEGEVERLSVVDTECRRLEVAKDEEIKKIVAKYAPQIDPLVQEREERMKKLGDMWIEHEALMKSNDSKTAVFRSGTLSARTSPGSLVVNDEGRAIKYLRRVGKLKAFTRLGKRTLDKAKLKKDLAFVKKVPGIFFDQPEFLSIKLARTKIELKEDLHPHRQRIN